MVRNVTRSSQITPAQQEQHRTSMQEITSTQAAWRFEMAKDNAPAHRFEYIGA